jgi:chorismate dehydratase
MQSKAYGLSDLVALAHEHADRFGVPARTLIEYWRSFSYDLGEDEQRGLSAFYGYAADLGVIKPVTELRFWNKS